MNHLSLLDKTNIINMIDKYVSRTLMMNLKKIKQVPKLDRRLYNILKEHYRRLSSSNRFY